MPSDDDGQAEFDAIMERFRAEMEQFHETMREVDDILGEVEDLTESSDPEPTAKQEIEPSATAWIDADMTVSLENWR